MSADTLARVFEPFFTTKRFGLGSGLGLSMAYGFAKQSGGGIAIQSQPGRGTTVLMVLPLIRPGAETADDGGSELPSAGDGALVLLVEDDAAVRRVVRQQLVDLGYPVIEAENGAQALELVDQVPDIAIMVSDVIMPGGINGRQLAEQVLARNPRMRVVLMSGYAEESEPVKGYELPVLCKPFARRDLARAIAETGEKT
jgi:CheY-like chemotaxis protein